MTVSIAASDSTLICYCAILHCYCVCCMCAACNHRMMTSEGVQCEFKLLNILNLQLFLKSNTRHIEVLVCHYCCYHISLSLILLLVHHKGNHDETCCKCLTLFYLRLLYVITDLAYYRSSPVAATSTTQYQVRTATATNFSFGAAAGIAAGKRNNNNNNNNDISRMSNRTSSTNSSSASQATTSAQQHSAQCESKHTPVSQIALLLTILIAILSVFRTITIIDNQALLFCCVCRACIHELHTLTLSSTAIAHTYHMLHHIYVRLYYKL
jgi:hypothetical protein